MKTQQQEIAALKAFGETMGKDSYVGPWILSVLAEVESDIRSDFDPVPTVKHAREQAAIILDEATTAARRIRDDANTFYVTTTEDARSRAEQISRCAASNLRQALKTLES